MNLALRRTGTALSLIGLGLGTLLGVGWLLQVQVAGLPWIVVVGLVKLGFLGSVGMIGAGAVMRRLASWTDRPPQLPPGED